MITDWAVYYQQNKHLPLNRVMEDYKVMLNEFNEMMTLITQQSGQAAGGGGGPGMTIRQDVLIGYRACVFCWKSCPPDWLDE